MGYTARLWLMENDHGIWLYRGTLCLGEVSEKELTSGLPVSYQKKPNYN